MKRSSAFLALLATGCASMEPHYVRPEAAIPTSWPVGDAYLAQNETSLPTVAYSDVFKDPRLQGLIRQALANNRDLMIAAANIAAARAQYSIQRAQQFPTLTAGIGATAATESTRSTSSSNSGTSPAASSNVAADFTAGLSVPSFELDLFGRLRSLTHAQLEQYFATEAAARATRLALVAEIANAWLAFSSDSSLLRLAQQTADNAQKSVDLTRARLHAGIAPRTDLSQAEQILTSAQANLASQRTAVAQDVNALQLLAGAPVDPQLLSNSVDEAGPSIVDLPAGVNSYVLLRRPDVMEAEYQLRAANAEIGAARAALFPRISLTGLLGFASTALTSLFTGGAFGWSAGGSASYSIFQGGAGRANVRLSEAQRDAAVANYQKAVQTAFREVSDALAREGTMQDQLTATQRQQDAAGDVYKLEQARYGAGIDSYLNLLDAQRSFYSAQQVLITTKLAAAQNRVTLYQTLGADSLYPDAASASGK